MASFPSPRLSAEKASTLVKTSGTETVDDMDILADTNILLGGFIAVIRAPFEAPRLVYSKPLPWGGLAEPDSSPERGYPLDQFRTVWLIDAGDDWPRFVTSYPMGLKSMFLNSRGMLSNRETEPCR